MSTPQSGIRGNTAVSGDYPSTPSGYTVLPLLHYDDYTSLPGALSTLMYAVASDWFMNDTTKKDLDLPKSILQSG